MSDLSWLQHFAQSNDMNPAELDAIRRRIQRAFAAVRFASGSGYEVSYQANGTDFTTNFTAIGIKAPEQLQDDFLNLFIWTWSLKDYLKSCFKAKGLQGKAVEDEASRCKALAYVSDIANKAKHGELRKSRSGEFAELVNVGFNAPDECIERIVFSGLDVTLLIKDPQMIIIHATVATQSGGRYDALAVLTEAMDCWESNVLSQIEA